MSERGHEPVKPEKAVHDNRLFPKLSRKAEGAGAREGLLWRGPSAQSFPRYAGHPIAFPGARPKDRIARFGDAAALDGNLAGPSLLQGLSQPIRPGEPVPCPLARSGLPG